MCPEQNPFPPEDPPSSDSSDGPAVTRVGESEEAQGLQSDRPSPLPEIDSHVLISSNRSAISFCLGLGGLNALLMFFAGLAPLLMMLAEDLLFPSNGYLSVMLGIQTIFFPPIICFAFATVTPMFWYGSVLVRFAAGILMVIPGCLLFYFLMNAIEGHPPDDFWLAFSGVMFTQFLTAGSIALVIQMWTPWTLVHNRDPQTPLPRLGTRAILELTGVAATGYAVFRWEGFQEIWEGVLFFAVMGCFSSLAVIAALIALLRNRPLHLGSTLVAFAAAFAMACLMCGFFAVQEFGLGVLGQSMFPIAGCSLYGAAIICGVMWLCIRWLRICGWRCVHRQAEKQATGS